MEQNTAHREFRHSTLQLSLMLVPRGIWLELIMVIATSETGSNHIYIQCRTYHTYIQQEIKTFFNFSGICEQKIRQVFPVNATTLPLNHIRVVSNLTLEDGHCIVWCDELHMFWIDGRVPVWIEMTRRQCLTCQQGILQVEFDNSGRCVHATDSL